jgi:DNA-binding CsgD family transcriptional regulator
MSELEIDDKTRAALGRLTAGERECLERRLYHQTAKEIALELGVSPHAVEKRLKMARAKLGLSSSLQVARLLAATAGEYQQTGPQTADLPSAPPASERRFDRPLILGGLVMILVTAALIALAAQSSGGAAGSVIPSAPVGETKPDNFRMAPASDFVDGTPEELRAFAEDRFRAMDKDGSGFIEREEAPAVQIRLTDTAWTGDGPPPREWLEQQASRAVPVEPVIARAAYIARADADADGKLSFDEYLAGREAGFDGKQVPVIWREQRLAGR